MQEHNVAALYSNTSAILNGMDVIAFAFGLGVAGFDVFGVVIVLLLLASRVSKRRIVLFASIAFVGTVALGTVAAVLLGERVASLSQMVHRIPAVVWLCLEGVAAIALFGWAIYRLCVAPASDKPPKDAGGLVWALGRWRLPECGCGSPTLWQQDWRGGILCKA